MIMHVVTDFGSQGGAQTMLARLLAHSGEPAVVVSLVGVSDRNVDQANNPNVIYHALQARSLRALPRAVAGLAGLIRQHRPDTVLCWMYHPMVIGLAAAAVSFTRTPVFWTVRQALDDPAALTTSTRAAVTLSSKLSRASAGIIYNSDRARLQHAKYGFKDNKSFVIPNGFDVPDGQNTRQGPARVFGLAARFHPQKDYSTFLAAAGMASREVPDLRFMAAGDKVTADNHELLALIEKNGLTTDQVHLCGDLLDIHPFYEEIDVLVLSSRTEGFPNVIAEAMCHGRPVVSTDVGDSALIVDDCGYIVPPRDPEALAAAMVKVAKWPASKYRDKSLQARNQIARNYALPKIANAYEAVLTGDRSGAGAWMSVNAE